jgi:hypothetical protein
MTADDGSRRMTLVVALDRGTADRLLAGSLEPDDAPPGYADVSRLIRALGRPPTGLELGREDEAVAAAVAVRARRLPAVGGGRRRGARRSRLVARAKLIALAAIGTSVATAGLAAAGALPDRAQTFVSDVLSEIGITVPSAEETESSGGPDPGTPQSGDAGGTTPIAPLHGSPAPGAHVGGRGSANGDAALHGAPHGGRHGGTPTADAASGGASEHGTTIANERSDGHSAAGSDNAQHGPPAGHGPPGGRGPDGGHGHGSPASQGYGHGPPPGHPHGPPPGHG